MYKFLRLPFLLILFAQINSPASAQSKLYLSILSDRHTAYTESPLGFSQAFMCISEGPKVTTNDFCYGFFPAPDAINTINLDNGHTLTRTASDWIETPGGFHFKRQPAPPNKIVLFDQQRQVVWTLSVPQGPSQLSFSGHVKPWRSVVSVKFDPGASAFIGGVGMSGGYEEPVLLPAPSNIVYAQKISSAELNDIIGAVLMWNQGDHHLVEHDYIDFIQAVAGVVKAKQPDFTAAGYLEALIKLNHAARPDSKSHR